MMKNHKLAKAISDASWSELIRQIGYKANWYGRTFYQIDRWFPSSKTCNNCQFVKNKLSLKEREWICSNCKSVLDRDLNAAKNIRDKGLSDLKNLSSKEELSVCGTQSDIKQKPEEAFSSVSKVSAKKSKKQEKSKKREISKEIVHAESPMSRGPFYGMFGIESVGSDQNDLQKSSNKKE